MTFDPKAVAEGVREDIKENSEIMGRLQALKGLSEGWKTFNWNPPYLSKSLDRERTITVFVHYEEEKGYQLSLELQR